MTGTGLRVEIFKKYLSLEERVRRFRHTVCATFRYNLFFFFWRFFRISCSFRREKELRDRNWPDSDLVQELWSFEVGRIYIKYYILCTLFLAVLIA